MLKGKVSFKEHLAGKEDVSRIIWHSESPKVPSRPTDGQALLAVLADHWKTRGSAGLDKDYLSTKSIHFQLFAGQGNENFKRRLRLNTLFPADFQVSFSFLLINADRQSSDSRV